MRRQVKVLIHKSGYLAGSKSEFRCSFPVDNDLKYQGNAGGTAGCVFFFCIRKRIEADRSLQNRHKVPYACPDITAVYIKRGIRASLVLKAKGFKEERTKMKKMIRRLSVLFMMFVMVLGTVAPAASFAADKTDDYVYGTVNMDYADFYYGELEGIEPSTATKINAKAKDPVTQAGYRKEGFYDAATLATPRGFIYEKKWKTGYPGTFNEPIIDEYDNIVGGRILGVEAVNVAVNKKVYKAAMAAPKSVIGKKASAIKLNEDQSKVPLSYKVLNADGVYSKYVNLTDPVETDLDGYLTTEFMGDDIWWEGKAMKHTKEQTLLGGIIEYKKDPLDANEKPVVLGLKHDENMYSDTWIGWGMGPGNVGIYGGNETGWQRFSGISGKYLTKMSYILMEEDGSVHYYNASYNAAADTEGTQMKDLLNPYIPSGIVENGKHPYYIGISDYGFTKDRVLIDFSLDVPVRADGTPEADYYLNSINCPGGSLTIQSSRDPSDPKYVEPVYVTNPERVPVYKESEWNNGHKTIHIEISRKYMDGDVEKYFGTGRYKYWLYVKNGTKKDGDRDFTGIAAWKMLYTDETPDDIYLKENKLVVNSDIFTVKDYINNPYQQVEVYDAATGEQTGLFATGDANTNTTLFLGTQKQDGTPVKGLFAEDGSINFDAEKYTYNRRTQTETVEPIFENGNKGKYTIVLYSGGFPIVKGTVSAERAAQEITAPETVKVKFGDAAKAIGAKANSALTYKSDNEKIAVVDKNGKITAKGIGSCKITIKAKEDADYTEAVKEITVTVSKGTPKITASKKTFTVKAKKLKKAQKVTFKAKSSSGGKLTYKGKASGKSKKALKITKAGKITVKKGTKKGTYSIKVTVKSAAKGNYNAGSKAFTVKVKVK